MIRRPPRSTPLYSSAASDVYKRQGVDAADRHAARQHLHELAQPLHRDAPIPVDVPDQTRRPPRGSAPARRPRREVTRLTLSIQILFDKPFWFQRVPAGAGTDAIKVDPPEGDMVRHGPPFRGGISTNFASMNYGKRSIVLDLQMMPCLLYTSPSPRDRTRSRMPSSA